MSTPGTPTSPAPPGRQTEPSAPAKQPARWGEIQALADGLSGTDRRTLYLLARLPLVPAAALAALEGLASVAGTYRRLDRLRTAGLIHALPARLPAGPAFTAARSAHAPALFYLSDPG